MSARSYDARHRAYNARHRSSSASAKPSRRLAGLALPTAAAAALTFTATGAAMATTSHSNTDNKKAAANASASFVRPEDTRGQAMAASAAARAHAAARATRSAERQDLAVRNLAAKRLAKAHAWQMPLKSVSPTSSFGWRWGRLHAGEDFAAAVGTNLVAMSTGTVTFAGQESGYGNLVKIRYWDGTITFYGHMSHLSVNTGENVDPGEVVGQSGNTGESTGPHLHLEVHPDGGAAIDPVPWLSGHQLTL
ncbi:MAG: M23 family metallopeptidase [Dermatophilaceae bacterium]